jgi:putative tryptophan/tyrosine transport system substrate-binding protein
VRRREFITLLGGVAVAWPLAARAQQPAAKVPRIGVLTNLASDDPESLTRIGAFLQGLQERGWTDGRNVRIDYRWGAGDRERNAKYAAELVALAPAVILATGGPTVEPLMRATRTVPIVFVQVVDPVGAGVVETLAKPGGNATGFTSAEYGMSGKWLELLKELLQELLPGVKRVAVLRDTNVTGVAMLAALQAVAPSLGVELTPVGANTIGEIERAVTSLVRGANGALIVTPTGPSILHRDVIIALAARHRLPAVYGLRAFVTSGGLISYGADSVEPYRGAAGYVDRILRGENPADLPVQAPTKYELVINLKTAKQLGLDVPPTLLARADEVIE